MTVLYSTVQHSTAARCWAGKWPQSSGRAGATHRVTGDQYTHYTTLHYTTLRNVNTVIRTGAGAGDWGRVLINTPHVVSSEDSDNTSQSQ